MSVVEWRIVVFVKLVVSMMSYAALKQINFDLILLDPSTEKDL